MAKGQKRGTRRRKGDESSDEEEDDEKRQQLLQAESGAAGGSSKKTTELPLDFAQRRELQRKIAADKRRSKLKCHVCGLTGHVRRECPGILDDGRGESKYTKSKGDPGAKNLLQASSGAGAGKNSGSSNRRKMSHDGSDATSNGVALPPGFERRREGEKEEAATAVSESAATPERPPFLFYDSSCDVAATLEYLQTGRGAKNRRPASNARAEYQRAVEEAAASSNYGGLISRSVLRRGHPREAAPAELELELPGSRCFVVGLHRDFLCNDAECEPALASLLDASRSGNTGATVVGFFGDLDYTPEALDRPGCDRESQMRRLQCACQAAGEVDGGGVVQIRTSPSAAATGGGSTEDEGTPHAEVMADLDRVLEETAQKHPSVKIHLSCWSGSAEHMNKILRAYPANVWIGMDASVGFSKARHLHECAFDVPLGRLLLETGRPSRVPAAVGQARGRDAFAHSGLVPLVAEAVAAHKPASLGIAAADVARVASTNALELYPALAEQ